jgi:ferredoxin-NADP reductase/DMSO/TMAO reductase YedYZ heme-binding membrane subunit
MPVARFGLIVNLLIPLSLLIWDARHGKLGADPVNFAIHTTGLLAVICLLLSLCVTPLRMVTGLSWLVQFRRSLGVYAFYYACAHLAIYFWWDRQRSLSSTAYEITHRYYLAIGFASLALMAPLWATSFDRAIRAIGGTWWKRLHRLAYLAAALACYHFYLQVKSDHRMPDVAIATLGGLLLWRVVAAVVRRARRPAVAMAAAAPGAGAKARFWKGQLKVLGTFRETAHVRTFRLGMPDGGPIPFDYRAGQFLSLSLPIDGKRVTRSYTIASPPTRGHYVELTVKREDQGQVSRFLHDMLMAGHTVAVSAPGGRFTFDPATAGGVLLIAGGVGITPVMAILRDLTDRVWPGKIDLVFSVRSTGDVIFADELRLLASRHPNLHVHLTVTRDAPADWAGHRGRITAGLLRQLVPDVATRAAFVCGPDTMAMAARDELVAAGVPADRVTLESFTPAAATPDTAVGNGVAATATVTFARSDRSAPLPANRTILDVAESAGVRIDFECRSGICGTCRCKLLSGRVTMDVRDALSDADEAEGYILACQAHATEDVVIDA